MSRFRLVFTFVLMIAALVPAAGFVIQAFPLQGQPIPATLPAPIPLPAPVPVAAATRVPAPAPEPAESVQPAEATLPETQPARQEPEMPRPVQVVRMGANMQMASLIKRVTPVYPPEAKAAGIGGSVQAAFVIGRDGAVKQINVMVGPPMLVAPAEAALRQWMYKPTLLNGEPVDVISQTTFGFMTDNTAPGPQFTGFSVPAPEYPAELKGSGIEGMVRFKVYVAQDGTVRDLIYLDGDRSLITAAENAARQARFVVQPPGKEVEGEIALSVTPDSKGGVIQLAMTPSEWPAPNTPFPSTPPPDGVQRVRVGGLVQSALLIDKPQPVYPAIAQQARIQGTVRLQLLLAIDGTVKQMQLVSGHPLLVTAAQEAVRNYRYRPTLMDGKPVEVVTQVDVNFPPQ